MAVPLASIEPLRPILAQRPFGLISDIDGTLSPIVPRPEAAVVPPGIRRLLSSLMATGVRIAVVTGRPLREARERVPLEGIAYVGNHGLEVWVEGEEEQPPGVAEFVAKARAAQAELSPLEREGLRVENKGPVIAVHYRLAADPAAARRAVLAAIDAAPAAKAFRLHEGKKVVELRPSLPVDKGTAACSLIQRFGLRGVLCLGDDVTDIDMFDAVHGLAGVHAACVAVASEEAPPEVLASADYSVDGVEGVEWLLGQLLIALS